METKTISGKPPLDGNDVHEMLMQLKDKSWALKQELSASDRKTYNELEYLRSAIEALEGFHDSLSSRRRKESIHG